MIHMRTIFTTKTMRRERTKLGVLIVSVVTSTISCAAGSAIAAEPIQSRAQEHAPHQPLPNFVFRGHRIGEPLPPSCDPDREGEVETCEDEDVRQRGFIGDTRVSSLTYRYLNRRLIGFTMSIALIRYEEVRAMLLGRYGKPTAEINRPVQNQMGSKLDSLVTEWQFAEGTLRLIMRYPLADTSWIAFENAITTQQLEERERLKNMARGRRLF